MTHPTPADMPRTTGREYRIELDELNAAITATYRHFSRAFGGKDPDVALALTELSITTMSRKDHTHD